MKTDWYKTERPGTYVAVPAGTPLAAVRLPADVHAPLDLSKAGDGWQVVIAEVDGRRVSFKVPPGAPDVDPAALVLMKHRA